MVPTAFLTFLIILTISEPSVGDYSSWQTDAENAPFIYFESTLLVPPVPDRQWQTLFVWPGLQPTSSSRYLPIDNGVLQPVLTYGYSCAPNPTNLQIVNDETWWISAQYVNTYGSHPGFTGCQGGPRMAVEPGDSLRMVMQLKPGTTIWKQTVTNLRNGRSVSFSKDMKGQPQGSALLVLEPYGTWGENPPKFVFSDIVLKATRRSSGFCRHSSGHANNPGAGVVCTKAVLRGATCRTAKCTFN